MQHKMNIPLLDLKGQMTETMREEMIQEFTQVLDSTRYIMGPKVEKFEQEIAEYTGTPFAIGVSSGTDALLLALMGLNIQPNEVVLVPDFSFFATAGVVARLQAIPLFIDIDPITYNLDPHQVRRVLEGMPAKQRKQVKAMIPVHLYGQSAEMKPLLEIAKEFNLAVIEDAAQSIGAEYSMDGTLGSSGSWGDVGCYSFFPSKNLGGLGDAGMIVTHSEELAHQIRIKRVHGGEPKYYHKVIGGNFRIDPLQAAMLSIKLPHLNAWHRERQKNAQHYDQLFQQANLSQITTPQAIYAEQNSPFFHIYNQYVLRVEHREQLRPFLQQEGISTEIYYPVPFHQQECFQYLSLTGDYSESAKAAKEVLALPIYPGMTTEMREYVVQKIQEFYAS